jgi:hypothetical protein
MATQLLGPHPPEFHPGRGDGEYERIARYIRNNPMNWERDRFGNNAGR